MCTKSFVLIVIALLIQSAYTRPERIPNGRLIKLYRPQQRSIIGQARFTADILNKLALKGKLTTTTAEPTLTTITVEPTFTSGTGPSATTTTGTLTYPETITSGTRPDLITSDTSAPDSGYSPTSSSPTPGDDTVTSLPQQPPDNVAPVEVLPDNPDTGEAITSRAAAVDDLSKQNDDDGIDNIILYEYNDKYSLKTKPEQLKQHRIQQANRRKLPKKVAKRKTLSRRKAANLRNRRKTSHRRRLLRRRINAKREAEINAILRRRGQIAGPNNRYQLNNNAWPRYRRRPVQRIIIRQL